MTTLLAPKVQYLHYFIDKQIISSTVKRTSQLGFFVLAVWTIQLIESMKRAPAIGSIHNCAVMHRIYNVATKSINSEATDALIYNDE